MKSNKDINLVLVSMFRKPKGDYSTQYLFVGNCGFKKGIDIGEVVKRIDSSGLIKNISIYPGVYPFEKNLPFIYIPEVE